MFLTESEKRELIKSITEAFGSEIIRYGDFEKALLSAGYAIENVSTITNDLLKRHEIGRVSFRQVRKNKPSRRSFVAITAEAKRN